MLVSNALLVVLLARQARLGLLFMY